MDEQYMDMRVAKDSDVKALAGAIAIALRGTAEQKPKKVRLSACGANALNQSVKAVAIARGYVAQNGFDLVMRPGFKDGEINGESRSILQLFISLV